MGRSPTAGLGRGAALVLLHGGLSDGRSWAPQLESLAHEYDVIAWDAPGCGGSADPAADLRLADYADAVASLVARSGPDRSTCPRVADRRRALALQKEGRLP